MHTPAEISEIKFNAILSHRGRLSQKEREFVHSVYQQSQRPGFVGLSAKQASWLSAIELKLETEHRDVTARAGRRALAYAGTCITW